MLCGSRMFGYCFEVILAFKVCILSISDSSEFSCYFLFQDIVFYVNFWILYGLVVILLKVDSCYLSSIISRSRSLLDLHLTWFSPPLEPAPPATSFSPPRLLCCRVVSQLRRVVAASSVSVYYALYLEEN